MRSPFNSIFTRFGASIFRILNILQRVSFEKSVTFIGKRIRKRKRIRVDMLSIGLKKLKQFQIENIETNAK